MTRLQFILSILFAPFAAFIGLPKSSRSAMKHCRSVNGPIQVWIYRAGDVCSLEKAREAAQKYDSDCVHVLLMPIPTDCWYIDQSQPDATVVGPFHSRIQFEESSITLERRSSVSDGFEIHRV